MGLEKIIEKYKGDVAIATSCSHSSLQIFNGARKEGFKSIGIAIGKKPDFYEAFPLGKPDEFIILKNYNEINKNAEKFYKKKAIIIPHGSFVEYMGAKNFMKLKVPTFGNKKTLEWESDREKERKWLESAGLKLPETIEDPKDIDRPVIVKYYGAKGGKNFFIARSYEEFKKKVEKKPYTIQEFLIGTRYYLHYFYSPLIKEGYRTAKGSLQLLSIDRRDETNIDEAHRLGSFSELEKMGIQPTFVVTGNTPIVIRESLLPKVFEMGKRVVEASYKLFGGIIGPFCLETVITDKLEIKVFEISGRIVAGTNLFISGSTYSDLIQPSLSTGRRIAQEIKFALEEDSLEEILT
ncbi:MAG: formate--phosphoribosylaminoimidazolecarboxamide ligase [Thermoplasmatales archaeon]|nr:formate--phosphoribosylaminoimidazolecarboxamide ligase [Thermoplasmatales archaeon]